MLRLVIIPISISFLIFNTINALLYYYNDILKITINLVLISLYIFHAIYWSNLMTFLIYISIIYLNLKFDEIIHSLRVRIRWNNMQGLMAAIAAHHKATHLVRLLAKAFNVILGIIYLIIPYIIVFVLKLLSISKTPLYIRIFGSVVLISSLTIIYLLNFLCATVTTKNKNAPRHLYRVFCSYKFIDLKHRFKILGLLEKLTYDFVGFHCLDLFKFTKQSFYQYFMTITSTYILVSKLLR